MSCTNRRATKAGRVRPNSVFTCALAAVIVAMATARVPAQCTEQQKLTILDAAADDTFGWSVSVSGDTAVVGAPFADCAVGSGCGAAYVYRFDGKSWVEEQKLPDSDASSSDEFGRFISVSGDTVVVGARLDDCPAGIDCGAAYVFRFNGTSWIQEQKLTASDAAAGDEFGSSVSVSGDTVVVGAYGDDCAAEGSQCGAAYVFRFSGTLWVQEQKLTASDAATFDAFGASVSVSGDMVVAGAPLDNCEAGQWCGSAYVFHFDGTTWGQEQKLTAPDAAWSDRFGSSVSVSGDTAVVGAYLDFCEAVGGGINCGSAYVFRFNGLFWVLKQKLTASDAARGATFGTSVSVSGDTVLVGANGAKCAAGFGCGAAYVYRLNGNSWVEEQKLIASDAAASAHVGWSVSLSGDTAVVGAFRDDCAAGVDCGSAYVFELRPACPSCGNGNLDPAEACDGGLACTDCSCDPGFEPTVPGSLGCQLDCGDGLCHPAEDSCSCAADCGTPPSNELLASTCDDGFDNDCDGLIDSADSDCAAIPTVSRWGLILVTLLLLASAKVVFRRGGGLSGSVGRLT